MSTDLLPSETKPMASSVPEGKYLTFNLADETYGVGVLEVREIIRHPVQCGKRRRDSQFMHPA
jgi:chemotaxis signal transduction protein